MPSKLQIVQSILKNHSVMLISMGLIIFAIVLTLLSYGSYLSFLSIFVTDALWASVLLTVVLVVVNISSTIQNRQTIREMEKARKAEFMPNVKMQLTWIGATSLALKGKNFGKDPAINLKAEIIFLPSDAKRKWTAEIFSPNQSIKVWLPDSSSSKICNSAAQIVVKGEYYDIFGQKYLINESIDSKEIIDEINQLQVLSDERTYEDN